jgi:hypothetical protein
VALAQPLAACAQSLPALPGVQIYCTTVGSGPALNGLVPLTCNSSGAANINGGGGGGAYVFPYSYTFNQTPQPASFLGIAGFDGTYVQPASVNSAGQLAVTGSFYQAVQPVSIATTIPVSIATTIPVSIATTVPVAPATTFPVSIASTIPVLVTNTPVPTFTPAPAYSMQPAQPVIAQPPNGTTFPVNQTAAATQTGTLSATGSVTLANATGAQGAYVVTTSSSFVGTYVYQGTDAAGNTHTLSTIPGGSRPANVDTSETAAQSVYLDISGMTSVSVTVTAYTSGSLTAYIQPLANVPNFSGGTSTNGGQSYRGGISGLNLCQVNSAGNVAACATINSGAAGTSIGTGNSQLNVAGMNYGYTGTGWLPQPACNQYAIVNVSAAGTTTLITGSSSYITRVCSFVVETQTAATTWQLGVSTSCASAPTAIVNYTGGVDQVFTSASNFSAIFTASTAPQNVCLNVSGSSPVVTGYVMFSQ